jgi:hypothetical protein
MAAMCDTCKIIIRWQATVVDGKTYCCPGCARGGPCNCDYDNLPQEDNPAALTLRRERLEDADHNGARDP